LTRDLQFPPLQQRTRESVERILTAGVQIMTEADIDALTVAEVAQRAGVSIPAIYRRFGNKDELLVVLVDHAMQKVEADQTAVFTGEHWDNLPTGELVKAAVNAVASVIEHHGPLLRTLILHGPSDARIRERGSAGAKQFGDQFTAMLLTRRTDLQHGDPDLAAQMCFSIIYDALIRRLAFGPTFESRHPIELRTFVQQLGEICTAYLLGNNQAADLRSAT
jgi:AcrR family transcriptional regulator